MTTTHQLKPAPPSQWQHVAASTTTGNKSAIFLTTTKPSDSSSSSTSSAGLPAPNKTYLHSERLKRSLNESRKAFLSFATGGGSNSNNNSSSSSVVSSAENDALQTLHEKTTTGTNSNGNVEIEIVDGFKSLNNDNDGDNVRDEENLDSLGAMSDVGGGGGGGGEKRSAKQPSRKISFKIKRNVGLSRRSSSTGSKNITTYSASTVAQLTLKFNRMVEENKSILEEPKFARLVKRVNSQKKPAALTSTPLSAHLHHHPDNTDRNYHVKVTRKPSVKLKPIIDAVNGAIANHNHLHQHNNNNKSLVKRKTSVKKVTTAEADKYYAEGVPAATNSSSNSGTGTVRATIERFERQTSKEHLNLVAEIGTEIGSNKANVAQKPKVPEKTVAAVRTKNLVIKDGVKKFKIYERRMHLHHHHHQTEPKEQTQDISSSNKDDNDEDEETKQRNPTVPSQPVEEPQPQPAEEPHPQPEPEPKNAPEPTAKANDNETVPHDNCSDPEPPYSKPGDRKFKVYETCTFGSAKTDETKTEVIVSNTTTTTISSSSSSSKGGDATTYQTVISISGRPAPETPPTPVPASRRSEPPDIPPPKLPSRNAKSVYEPLLQHHRPAPRPPTLKLARSEEVLCVTDSIVTNAKPNNSFLWRQMSKEDQRISNSHSLSDLVTSAQANKHSWEDLYDTVDPTLPPLQEEERSPHLLQDDAKIYEDLRDYTEIKYEEVTNVKVTSGSTTSDDGYEYCASPTSSNPGKTFEEALYETLPSPRKSSPAPEVPRRPSQPLPPRPGSYYSIENGNESASSNCYESIYSAGLPPPPPPDVVQEAVCSAAAAAAADANNYESIYGAGIQHLLKKPGDRWSLSSNRDSTLSFDQQSNSLYGRSIRGWTPSPEAQYGGRAASDFSSSDKSDEWIDMSEPEEDGKQTGFVIVRERLKNKKSLGWTKNVRDQFNKVSGKIQDDPGGFGDSDHHYESLCTSRAQECLEDDYDSFSDSDSEISYSKTNQNDSGVDMGNSQLPEPPGGSNVYGLTKLAKKLRRNWSTTKNDITKSLSRMTKKKSRTDLDKIDNKSEKGSTKVVAKPTTLDIPTSDSSFRSASSKNSSSPVCYSNIQYPVIPPPQQQQQQDQQDNYAATGTNEQRIYAASSVTTATNSNNKNTLTKKKYWTKFRRSMSVSEPREAQPQAQNNMGQKPKSTFYLTDTIDIDNAGRDDSAKPEAQAPHSGNNKKQRPASMIPMRPQSPPPPAPISNDLPPATKQPPASKNNNSKRSTSWYSECGLFKAEENGAAPAPPTTVEPAAKNYEQRHSSSSGTCWYAEIGLYQSNRSTPSTSSAENSGNGTAVNSAASAGNNQHQQQDLDGQTVQVASIEDVNNDDEYYNLKNGRHHHSTGSTFHVDWRINYHPELNGTKSFESTHSADTLLCLQDEPLYQFYDAAVADSAARDDVSDSDDYDGYEEIGNQDDSGISMLQTRPSAMQLVQPKKPGAPISRTLWCEIPEVVQSAVLSTLTPQQKKIQEAKFEIVTSEASYVNSLNVLKKHFVANLEASDLLSENERETLFGKVEKVKECSEKLLADLESCWQDSILLTGISDVLRKHVQDNFYAYVSYCQNQVIIDYTLKKLKERPQVKELLRQLEMSPHCQSLSLYSFLMLPMQRVTRLPLLVDAVLKRLTPQDEEYLSCQQALSTINKIVKECNEAARKAEQEMEIKTIAQRIEFPKHMTPFKIESNNRWLVRSGPLTQLQARNDETKLTFGKRFNKMQLHLFLFNDMLLITKSKGEENYSVLHYCSRSFIDLTPTDTITQLPIKDTQGRHLIYLTVLENHEKKTVEMLLSCCSESDKVRWQEALSPPVSENPDETLYEFWDCPQVRVIHPYVAMQPDDLGLSQGDVINVTRKLVDGWYYGEKIRDGQTGWFPASYTQEIANPHVRARHLKQRHRFLNYTVSCYNKPR